MPVRKTNEQFLKEVYDLVGDEYTFLEKYANQSTKLKVRHNKCGHEYKVTPLHFLCYKWKCPKCAIKNRTTKITKTNEQFLKEVYDLVGDEYTFLEKYKTTNSLLKVRHNKCGHEYKATPNTFLNKKCKCPKCSAKKVVKPRTKTNKQFLKEVYDLVKSEYTFLEEYVNSKCKLKVRHNKCGYEYKVAPYNFLKGKGCPKCANNIKRTNEQFLKEVYDLVGDEYTFLEEYINTDTPIKVKHNKCGHEYKVTPKNFLNRKCKCPKCNKLSKESYFVKVIKKCLDDKNIEYEEEYKLLDFDKRKAYDIFIPSLDLIIEYDGMQHFYQKFNSYDDFIVELKRDHVKNEYILKTNLSLVRIDYKNNKNIDKIINGLIEKRSTTIEKYELYSINENNIITNEIKYYTKCNPEYFSYLVE